MAGAERAGEAGRGCPFPVTLTTLPNLPPAAACTQDLGLHQEPSPHGLSHLKHLSLSLPG